MSIEFRCACVKAVQGGLAVMVLLATGAILFVVAKESVKTKPVQDMVQFWAAARLIRQDPYSVKTVPALEKSVGSNIASANDLCSYYSFGYDEVILLPALLASAAVGKRAVLFAGLLLTDLGYAVYLFNLGGVPGSHGMFLWWTGTAWFLTYLLSRPAAFQSATSYSQCEKIPA